MADEIASEQNTETPEAGEVRALNGLSWEPWVIVTRVETDEDDNLLARFAVLDEMDDDVLNPVPDAWMAELWDSVGDRERRKEFAKAVDRNADIDKRWCPVNRLDALGEPHIQGAPPKEVA